VEDIDTELTNPTDKRIFAIAAAFYRGYSVEKIWQMTNIDKWFLNKLENIHKMEEFLTYETPVLLESAILIFFAGSAMSLLSTNTPLDVQSNLAFLIGSWQQAWARLSLLSVAFARSTMFLHS
jgi:Carbamoyl-phosphate synthetase large chain, oligomerisation domain